MLSRTRNSRRNSRQSVIISLRSPNVIHSIFFARAEEYLVATGAESMRGMLMGFLKNLPDRTTWAAKQAYIALGFGLAAATEEQIASCPMEGFNTGEVAKLLKLPKNQTPCVYLAVGEKAENSEEHPRFRFPKSDLVEEIE
jgi:nitroreductase